VTAEQPAAPPRERPGDPARALHAALWAACAFAAVYPLQGALHLPALLYDPVGRRLLWGAVPQGTQMRYYSDLAGACLAALAAAGLNLGVRPRPPRPLLLLGTLGALVAYDVVYFFSRVLSVR
jgi:hypothetical protein